MGFWDKVKDAGATAKELGNKGLDKAKDLNERAKMQSQISHLEDKIQKICERTAADIFENHPQFVAENYPQAMQEVGDAKAEIERLKAAMEELKKGAEE